MVIFFMAGKVWKILSVCQEPSWNKAAFWNSKFHANLIEDRIVMRPPPVDDISISLALKLYYMGYLMKGDVPQKIKVIKSAF